MSSKSIHRLLLCSVIVLGLWCATARAESPIDSYELFKLTWGSSVRSLHEMFPDAKEGKPHADDDDNGIQRWYLTSSDKIKDFEQVNLVFVKGKLCEFQLIYATEGKRVKVGGGDVLPQIDWKQLLKGLSDKLGEPEAEYEESGLKLVYHWDFPTQRKEVFFLPPQTIVQTRFFELHEYAETNIDSPKFAVVELRMKDIPGEPKNSGFARYYTEGELELQRMKARNREHKEQTPKPE